jgi:hypothetical protein
LSSGIVDCLLVALRTPLKSTKQALKINSGLTNFAQIQKAREYEKEY